MLLVEACITFVDGAAFSLPKEPFTNDASYIFFIPFPSSVPNSRSVIFYGMILGNLPTCLSADVIFAWPL